MSDADEDLDFDDFDGEDDFEERLGNYWLKRAFGLAIWMDGKVVGLFWGKLKKE